LIVLVIYSLTNTYNYTPKTINSKKSENKKLINPSETMKSVKINTTKFKNMFGIYGSHKCAVLKK